MRESTPRAPRSQTAHGHRIVIITGLSGAGKTAALRTFEDAGYFCIDNLPPRMIPDVMETAGETTGGPGDLVVVVDIRGRHYFGEEFEARLAPAAEGWERLVVFVDADDPTLVRRYKESRRPHPAASDGDVLSAIRSERRYLAPLREQADLVVDTSNLSAGQIRARFNQLAETLSGRLTVSLISFGFKYGAPLDVDMLLDVRFLPNPHYDLALRPMAGTDAPVREAVLGSEDAREFLRQAREMLDFLVPRYAAEGKTYFTLGIGCTGGRHRSVVIAEELARHLESLREEAKLGLHLRHRDIENS